MKKEKRGLQKMIVNKKRSIGAAAKEIGVQEHVIRFWENQFPEYIKPTIGNGNRRYYFDEDINILATIKDYLHNQGYTIKGLKNLMKTKNIFTKNNLNNIATKEVNPNVKIYRETVYMPNNSMDDDLKASIAILKEKMHNFFAKLQSL